MRGIAGLTSRSPLPFCPIDVPMRARKIALVVCAVTLLMPGSTWAGSGTQADPYHTGNAGFTFANNPAISYWYQDITPNAIKSGGWNFWHTNIGLSPSSYYIGFQSNGTVGVGSQGQVPRSAHFSLFGGGYSAGARKIIDTVHCGPGADGPTQGVSCAVPRTWSVGTQYRIQTDVAPITFSPWCPANAAYCTVYIGSMMLSGSSTATQIGAWSVLTPTLGPFLHTSSGYSSLESAVNPTCGLGPAPKGTYVIPFKNAGGSDFTIASDYATEDAISRGRWYNDWLSWVIYYC